MDWELLYRNYSLIFQSGWHYKVSVLEHAVKLISDIREQMSSYINSDMFEEDNNYLEYTFNYLEYTFCPHQDDISTTKLKLPSELVLNKDLVAFLSNVLSSDDYSRLKVLWNKYDIMERLINSIQESNKLYKNMKFYVHTNSSDRK